MKNITLTADEHLIEKARERARRNRTTLNEAFRAWLASYANPADATARFDALMDRLSYAGSGRRLTRDEMNER